MRFLHFFRDIEFRKMRHTQVQAYIDALALVTAADGEILEEETREMEKILSRLPTKETDPAVFVSNALARADAALESPDDLRAALERIKTQLDERWLLERVYQDSAIVSQSDDIIVPQESDLLRLMIEVFEIADDDLRRLTNELIRQNKI